MICTVYTALDKRRNHDRPSNHIPRAVLSWGSKRVDLRAHRLRPLRRQIGSFRGPTYGKHVPVECTCSRRTTEPHGPPFPRDGKRQSLTIPKHRHTAQISRVAAGVDSTATRRAACGQWHYDLNLISPYGRVRSVCQSVSLYYTRQQGDA